MAHHRVLLANGPDIHLKTYMKLKKILVDHYYFDGTFSYILMSVFSMNLLAVCDSVKFSVCVKLIFVDLFLQYGGHY